MKTKKYLIKEIEMYEIQNQHLSDEVAEMENEMFDACNTIANLKEEIAYLRGVIDGGPSHRHLASPDKDKGVLKLKGFSVSIDPEDRVTDVDAMAHACEDQIEWCDENEIEISEGGNADKN